MKKSMVAAISSASITGMLLVGCGSAGLSSQPETVTNKLFSNPLPDKTVLEIDTPKPQQTFHAGDSIPVSGSIHRTVKDSVVNVWLFQIPSIAENTRRTFIAKSSFPIGADGSFKGNFQVPKPPFKGSDGSEFVMVFSVPGKANISFSITQVVYLSIPPVKSSQ